MELRTIHEPGNRLVIEIPLGPVKLHPPDMVLVIREGHAGGQTARLVTPTAGVDIAVRRGMPDRLAVDVLHDVNLTAARPLREALAVGIRQHPERRPDALLPLPGVSRQTERALDPGDLAVAGQDGVLALDAGGRPAVGRLGVAAGDDLQGVGSAEEHVLRAAREPLELVVVVLVALDDVPVVGMGERATGAHEGGLPDTAVAIVLGSLPGGGDGRHGGQERGDLHDCCFKAVWVRNNE